MAFEYPEYTVDKLTNKMSIILSGAQGVNPCKVPRSTVFGWLQTQKRMVNEHALRIADGDDEFDTEPECDDEDPES